CSSVCERRDEVGRWQRASDRSVACKLYKKVLSGIDRRVRQIRDDPISSACRCVLERPAVNADRRSAAIEKLDEIVCILSTCGSAAAVELADNEISRNKSCLRIDRICLLR